MPTQIYQIGSLNVSLNSHPNVFTPSAHGLFFARNIVFKPQAKVLDVGTGSGILAVTAALHGAHVTATDVIADSLQLAQNNATLNNVNITTLQGSFFANIEGTFDQIVANLPQEVVISDPTHINANETIAIDGGERGNHLLLNLLKHAPSYMTQHSEIWLPLHTLSDFQHTLQVALANYNVRIHSIGDIPVKPFVINNLEIYKQLNEQGSIRIFNHHGQWFSQVWVIVLTLR